MTSRDHAILRRNIFVTGGTIAAALSLPSITRAAETSQPSLIAKATTTSGPMTTVTDADGTKIFYKDWGSGKPVVFFARLALGCRRLG